MPKKKVVPVYVEAAWYLNGPSSAPWIKKQNKWTRFAGKSTCAAVTHLGDNSQSATVKIVWKVTLIAGIIMTTVSTYFSASSFLNLAGNSEMVTQNLGSEVEHPKIHICVSSTFNETILNG